MNIIMSGIINRLVTIHIKLTQISSSNPPREKNHNLSSIFHVVTQAHTTLFYFLEYNFWIHTSKTFI